MSLPHPLVILGLDGGSFNVLDPLFARGELPHLRALAESGLRTELLSTLPVATLPAWTSFLTGSPPAQHGVTDLLMSDRHYGLTPATGSLRTLPTFLARLSAQGLAVASLGVPGTYPPEPVQGLCVAGFDAPGARQARRSGVWPASFFPQLQRWGGWRYATFHEDGGTHIPTAVQALCADVAHKQEVILKVMAMRRWDVLFVHLQASDTAAHHLWHTFDAQSPRHPTANPHADALPQVYRRLDALVGAVLAAAPPQARTLVVSDHGMGGAAAVAVHLNRFLQQQGVLQFKPNRGGRHAPQLMRRALSHLPLGSLGTVLRLCPAPLRRRLMDKARGMAVDHAHSAAFSHELDYAPSIWLNRRNAFAHGQLSDAQANTLQDHLAGALLGLRYRGQAVIRRVHRRQDLPAGPHAARLPDLVIEPALLNGYRPSFLPSQGASEAVVPLPPRAFAAPRGAGMPGVHRREGIFLASGPGLPSMELPPLHIHQAGAAVYALLGVPIPQDLHAQLPDYLLNLLQVTHSHQPNNAPHHANPYATHHSQDLLARLSGMGYL